MTTTKKPTGSGRTRSVATTGKAPSRGARKAQPKGDGEGPTPAIPRRRASVVVIGSINMDLVVRVPHLPAPGETLAGSSFQTLPGGKGANQAVAVARLGGRSILVGRVGDDAFGAQLVQGLRREGIDTRHVAKLPGTRSGVAVIHVEDSAQNSIAIVAGANARLRPTDLRKLESLIAKADAVLLQLEIPLETVRAALQIARRHEVFTVLDSAPVPPGGLPATLREMDILSPNQSEAALISGHPCDTPDDAVRAADVLIERHNPGIVVVKLGAQGSLAHAGTGDPLFTPSFSVKALDTTAAGDAFTAALTLRMAEGAELSEALLFANAAGALATTRMGAQNSMPTRAEVERFLRRAQKERSSRGP